VLSYRVILDVPLPLVLFVSKLLADHRREIGTRDGTRALTCWKQALFALAWFRDRPDIRRLGAGFGISQATAYRYKDEVTGDSMALGVSGRDGLALEFYGGGDLIAAGLPGHRQDGEPLGLLHPGRRAVGGLGCRTGEHRSVGARQVPAGPGTDELRCAGP
jgi:hypothetical protein